MLQIFNFANSPTFILFSLLYFNLKRFKIMEKKLIKKPHCNNQNDKLLLLCRN